MIRACVLKRDASATTTWLPISESIKSGWWINGPKVKEFEERFAKMIGTKYAIAVTSNTHGLDLILKAYDISNCDVLSPTMSFATTAAVPLWNNCTNILCDVDEINMNICPNDVKSKITENTKAIIEYKFNYNNSNKSADVALVENNNIKYIYLKNDYYKKKKN